MAKNETKAVLDNFTIKSYVDSLFESNVGNVRLTHFLNEYKKVLKEGATKEFMLYEEFGHGLANYASGNKAVKQVINEMNTNLATYGKELNTYKLMECICDDAAKCACEDAYTNYLKANDAKSKEILVNAVDVLEQSGDPVAPQLTIVIANPSAQLEPQQISTFDNESKFTEIQRKIEEDKLRQKVEDAKAEIDAYAEKKYAEMKAAEEAERSANVFDNVVNANGICLGESIKNIMNSEAKSNKKLIEIVEQYKGALNQGLYEERLYEGFIKNVTPFNYLNAVDKEIKRLNKVAEEHEVSINITKILEEMYTTNSYYIIPLIEEDTCRFIKNPTDVNCNQLKAALVSFNGDPYCRAIMEELERFNDAPSFLVNDKTMTIKDRARLIKEHANVSNIYSPVQYVKENECVFNANGQFYVKKGNTIAKLSEEYIPELKEDFIALCQLVNDPRVIINEDHITLLGGDKIANIYESYVDVNGNKESFEDIRDLSKMAVRYDFDNNFFIMTSCLAENFDNIANINFGKHIALNEDEGINADLFNLNGQIFVNTVNESMLKSTFYHNVNPIQCRNVINNHMGINVSYLFEDLLPSQDKLYLKLNEEKDEYEASIAKYEATIEKLKKAKEDDISEDSEKKLDAAIEAAQAKVDELKKEYKDWQDDVDKLTNPENKSDEKPEDKKEDDNKDDNTEVEKSNEPIEADEVDDEVKSDLSTPLSQEGHVTDDEFDSYLEGGREVTNNEEPVEEPVVTEEPTEEPVVTDEEPVEAPVDNEEDPFAEVVTDEEPVEAPTEEPVVTDEEPVVTDEEPVVTEEPVDEPVVSDEEPVDEPVVSDKPVETPGEQVEAEGVAMPEGYKIANITFDENLKTGELFRTGNISVMTDMVKSDGTLYTDTKSYAFYIDAETHLPVIEAGEIPVALYNAMVSSIQSDEKFGRADADGVEKPAETTIFNSDEKDFPDYDEVYYNSDDVNNVSDELQKDDEEGYFDFHDEPDGSLTITSKENVPAEVPATQEPVAAPAENTEDVIPADEETKAVKASELFNGVEDEPDEEEIITPTYTDGETVIDKPAENVELEEPIVSDEATPAEVQVEPEETPAEAEETPTEAEEKSEEPTEDEFNEEEQAEAKPVINEEQKITLNEARAAFIKLKAEYKKADETPSFLNEGASEPSKKEAVKEEEKVTEVSIIEKLYEYAVNHTDENVKITDIQESNNLKYFGIIDLNEQSNSMAVYEMNNNVYYGNYEDFNEILGGVEVGLNNSKDLELLEGEQPQCVSSEHLNDGYDLIDTILYESCKIKKPKLTADGDIKKTQMMADILNGTKDRQEFEKKVEKLSDEAKVPNPLVPQQLQESVNIEDANELSESVIDKENVEIIYEPEDWVIIKENGMKAQVTSVVNDGDGNLKMLTIVASNGICYDVEPDEIEPDPQYLANLPGNVVNSTLLGVPRLATFDINPKTRLTDIVNNDDPALEEKYKDFND